MDSLQRGIRAFHGNSWVEAIEELNKVRSRTAEPVLCLSLLAVAHARLGQYTVAEAIFSEVLSLNPERAASYYNLGLCYELEGKRDAARQQFLTAVRLDPEYANASRMLKRIGAEVDLASHRQAPAEVPLGRNANRSQVPGLSRRNRFYPWQSLTLWAGSLCVKIGSGGRESRESAWKASIQPAVIQYWAGNIFIAIAVIALSYPSVTGLYGACAQYKERVQWERLESQPVREPEDRSIKKNGTFEAPSDLAAISPLLRGSTLLPAATWLPYAGCLGSANSRQPASLPETHYPRTGTRLALAGETEAEPVPGIIAAEGAVPDGRLSLWQALWKPVLVHPRYTHPVKSAAPAPDAKSTAAGALFPARLRIPSIHLDAMVISSDLKSLNVALESGPVHFPNTALPGDQGNCVILGHNNIYGSEFRLLRSLESGDVVRVDPPQHHYVYRVVTKQVISPRATWILENSSTRRLTLITCYGERASERIAVTAELVTSAPT